MNLDDLLHASSPCKRMAVLKQLGEGFDLTRLSVEKALVAALTADGNAVVRHEAAFLLANLKERSLITGELALKALLGAVDDSSVLVRHEVALSLASYNCLLSHEALAKLCRDESVDVVVSARLALEQMED